MSEKGDVLIENPIINSPFHEPDKQFAFNEFGITNEVISGRRLSSYFIPIAGAKKSKTGQQMFDTEWTLDRIEENRFINSVRGKVRAWRGLGSVQTTENDCQLFIYNSEADLKADFSETATDEIYAEYSTISALSRFWFLLRASSADESCFTTTKSFLNWT